MYMTFIKRLFSSSSLSAIRVVSSAYLRLLIFLPAIFGLIEIMLVFKMLGNRSDQETGIPSIVDICSWTK